MLQVYALQETINKLGHNVKIIDYRMPEVQESTRLFRFLSYKKELKRPKALIRLVGKDIIYWPIQLRKRKVFSEFMEQFMKLTDVKFISYEDLQHGCQGFDAYICGSDQIWNPEITWGLNPAYFLCFVKSKSSKKIAYGASIGTDGINPILKDKFQEYVNNIDYLSVREKSLQSILKNFTDKQVTNVLDPTLLISGEEWSNIMKKLTLKEQYLLVYQLEANNELIKIVNNLSEKLNLKVVHFKWKKSFKNELARFPYAGPQDFLGLYRDASFVVTNSYHGTAFSIINAKQFLTIPHKTRGSRMIDLLETLGLSNRIVYSMKDLNKELKPIDYSIVNNRLDIEKQKSIKFLEDHLNNEWN